MSPDEGFVIVVKVKKALIGSCEVTIPIDVRQWGQFLARKLLTSQETVVAPYSKTMISLLLLPLPDDCDFLFHSAIQPRLTLFTHIVNYRISKVLVRNASNESLRIPYRHKLGHLIDIAYDNYFLTDTQSALDVATFPPSSYQPPSCSVDSPFLATNPSMETVLDNRVKEYGDTGIAKQIANLVVEYPTISESKGFVQIPPERWMTVPLKMGWESKVLAIKPQIYLLGNEARHVIDNTFDEMHRQGRLEYITDLFSFPVFVIYKTDSHGKRKGRTVVDIRKLNNLVFPDSYPLPLQSEIIANVQGCSNLAVLNTTSFFYQWRLHPNYCLMFNVITHHGQKTFQVPIMGYINSVAYVQHEIDNILRTVRS